MDNTVTTTAPTDELGSTLVALQEAGQSGAFTSQLLMMGAIFAIFYFLMIRPQQQEQKKQAELHAGLKKDDKVVTVSGLHGKVYEVRAHTVLLEVADRVRIEVEKEAVKRKADDGSEKKEG